MTAKNLESIKECPDCGSDDIWMDTDVMGDDYLCCNDCGGSFDEEGPV